MILIHRGKTQISHHKKHGDQKEVYGTFQVLNKCQSRKTILNKNILLE